MIKNYEKLRKGDQINTLGGYLLCKANKNGAVLCDEIAINDKGTTETTGERLLTLNEIGQAAKEADGINHYYLWQQEE